MYPLPKRVILGSCEFPIVESTVQGYRVLELPLGLRNWFNAGAQVLRVNSTELATTLPDYGGKTSGNYSLLPHQDHFGNTKDRRRFLVLSKSEDGERGAATLIMSPATARKVLEIEEVFFKDPRRRAAIAREYHHDPLFSITADQSYQCLFEDTGYEDIVRTVLGKVQDAAREISIRLNILGYLIRGPEAHELMSVLMQHLRREFMEERWEQGGVVIIDNASVYHARFGGNNPPLKRNFCV